VDGVIEDGDATRGLECGGRVRRATWMVGGGVCRGRPRVCRQIASSGKACSGSFGGWEVEVGVGRQLPEVQALASVLVPPDQITPSSAPHSATTGASSLEPQRRMGTRSDVALHCTAQREVSPASIRKPLFVQLMAFTLSRQMLCSAGVGNWTGG